VLNLRGHTGLVEGLACSPDGRRLATGSEDRTIKLWDTTTGEEVFTLRGHTAGVLCVAFSPDGQRIASGGYDRTVKVWDTSRPTSDALFQRGAESRVRPAELPADPFAPWMAPPASLITTEHLRWQRDFEIPHAPWDASRRLAAAQLVTRMLG
jgi:WD40 repeat protein